VHFLVEFVERGFASRRGPLAVIFDRIGAIDQAKLAGREYLTLSVSLVLGLVDRILQDRDAAESLLCRIVLRHHIGSLPTE
jgi:hypothetical protein